MIATSYDIGKDLCDALGLPKHTVAFSLSVRAGEFVTVECEYCPDIDKGSFVSLMATYELKVREAFAVPPAAMGFDAWMRERTEKAHAAYMAQPSDGGRDYAPLTISIRAI